MYLCGQVENTKWVLCCRKIGVNVRVYLRFFMYKIIFIKIKSKGFKFQNINFDKFDAYFLGSIFAAITYTKDNYQVSKVIKNHQHLSFLSLILNQLKTSVTSVYS